MRFETNIRRPLNSFIIWKCTLKYGHSIVIVTEQNDWSLKLYMSLVYIIYFFATSKRNFIRYFVSLHTFCRNLFQLLYCRPSSSNIQQSRRYCRMQNLAVYDRRLDLKHRTKQPLLAYWGRLPDGRLHHWSTSAYCWYHNKTCQLLQHDNFCCNCLK